MKLFEDQVTTRWRLDEKELEDAYARLAGAVMGSQRSTRFTLNDAMAADTAVDAVMAYYATKPASVPDDVVDPFERIEFAVRPTGVMHRVVRLEGKWWKDATGAYLATLLDGTPVAVLPLGLRGYGYVDPLTRRKVVVDETTAKNLKPEALCFYRPLPQRELSLRDLGEFIMRSLDWADWTLAAGATIASTAIGLLPAVLNKLLFGRVIPSGMAQLLLPLAALFLGVAFSQALIKMTSAVIMNRLDEKLRVQIEAATFARILLLPPGFFRDYPPGEVVSRMMGVSKIVNVLVTNVLGVSLTSVLSFVYIAQIFLLVPELAPVALVLFVLQVGVALYTTLASIGFNSAQMQASAKLSGVASTVLRGIQKIKVAGAERRAFARWASAYSDVARKTYDRPSLLIAAPVLITSIASVGNVVIFYLAAMGDVSTASFMAFSTAFGAIMGSTTQMARGISTAATLRPLLELVEPIMKTVPEVSSAQRQMTSVSGVIRVSNLSFAYEENRLVLKDLDIRVKNGEYVAIVGQTGCGKSTLIRLLLGFERPTRGAVLYGGQDITGVDIRSLRKNVGVVLQSSSLFMGDLLTNITVSNPKATLKDAWEAAEIACIADDIRKMPMGMNTIVSEGGGGLSGGQRQRILIARAVCGKPRVLIFDEATSALDNKTQRSVSDALERLSCTRIVVAHRLSTVRNADRILMLEDGHVVEEGTYDELVALDGRFADLVRRQRLEGE